jgi:predicted negative regulator of RcsB-dependent stress response
VNIQDNLKSIILGIVILCLGVGSYTYYCHHQENKELAASNSYEDLLNALRKKDKDKAAELATQLIANHPKTTYGALAALIEARIAIDERKLDEAVTHFKWVMNENRTFLQYIAAARLGRVLAEQKKYDEALAVLNMESKDASFKTLIEEIKGDIYLMKNEKDKAKTAYQIALSNAPQGAPVARIQLKQNDLSNTTNSSIQSEETKNEILNANVNEKGET